MTDEFKTTSPASDEALTLLHQTLMDKGFYIEAGWVSLRQACFPNNDASAVQLEEMRNAFFAGAQHTFHGIMTALDPGEEPSENDLKRMSLIDAELKRFIADFVKRRMPTRGSA
jgi:hypothetical protein